MEVIYTPPWQTIAAVVKLALEEDVDVVGISSLATDHLIVPKLMNALRDAGLGHMRVVVGGIVPDNEEALLLQSGVRQVFHPGSTMDEITARIRDYALEAREAGAHADQESTVMNKPVESPFAVGSRRRCQGALGARVRRSHRQRPRHRERLRHSGSAALRPGRLGGLRPGRPARLPRPARLHPRHLRHHAPRPHLDPAAADRPGHARRLQRAASRNHGARRDRGLADPVQLGLSRLRHGLGRARAARHLRRGRRTTPTTWTAASKAWT